MFERSSSLVEPSRVRPELDEAAGERKREEQVVMEAVVSVEGQDTRPGDDDNDGAGDGERIPQDGWLPITESRKGNTFTAACHLLCSGIGIQTLVLPVSFASLGWFWGVFCLSLAYSWQLYTKWLLVNLHESAPQTGIRYSRYLHLSMVAFGQKLGKLLAMFPLMYLSGGTCVLYIIDGGTTMELFCRAMCGSDVDCKANKLTAAEWFLVFVCLAIFIAQFFPNLNSLAWTSFIGSITALAYCTLLWALSVGKGERGPELEDGGARFRDVLNGIGILLLAFRGHNLVLEIQGTLPTNRKKPSRKPMWRGVIIAHLLIAFCIYPLAIVGYWAYGNKISANEGILDAFVSFRQNNKSKYITGAIYLTIIVNYLCAFQIYAMPTFDNLERLYTSTKNKPCPRWLRSAIKLLFGGLTYFIAVAFPFLPVLGRFVGSIALPLTVAYPCMIWVAIKQPRRFSRMWCLNVGLGSSGIVLSVLFGIAALWSLIDSGLDANFFKP